MITHDQYLKAKAIVSQYENQQELEDWDEEDDFDDRDWREEEEEAAEEYRTGLAATCTCGAWQFGKNGPVHVADCVCGAE